MPSVHNTSSINEQNATDIYPSLHDCSICLIFIDNTPYN